MISKSKISKVSFDISIIIDISSLSIDLFIWYLHLLIVLPTGRARFRRDSQSSEMVSIFRQSILWVDSSSNLIVLCIYWKVWYNLESTVLLTPSGDIRKRWTENLKSNTSEKPQISGSKKQFQGATLSAFTQRKRYNFLLRGSLFRHLLAIVNIWFNCERWRIL